MDVYRLGTAEREKQAVVAHLALEHGRFQHDLGTGLHRVAAQSAEQTVAIDDASRRRKKSTHRTNGGLESLHLGLVEPDEIVDPVGVRLRFQLFEDRHLFIASRNDDLPSSIVRHVGCSAVFVERLPTLHAKDRLQ